MSLSRLAPRLQVTSLLVLICLIFAFTVISLAQEAERVTGSDQDGLKIYLDCSSCDDDFFRTEISIASFVRDRMQADIHILVTRQRTGGGGLEYTVELIGRNHFDRMRDTLLFHSRESDTDDDIRSGLVGIVKLGLVRYIIRTPQQDKLKVDYLSTATREEIIDKWNDWIFKIGSRMWANGEKTSKSYSLSGDMSARRVTERLRLQFSVWGNYDENRYDFDGDVTLNISRRRGMSTLAFFSLSDHWSVGYNTEWITATYNNLKSRVNLNLGLEYNFYPYSESTRRQLRFMYFPNIIYVDYDEETLYDKQNEWLARQMMEITLEMTEPWGEADLSISAFHYFHDISKYRISAYGELSIRLYEGLSVDLWGSGSKIRDQLSLRKGESSLEDILLRRTEQATSYSYYFSMGLSYSFGSIYNNVVNPRFGY